MRNGIKKLEAIRLTREYGGKKKKTQLKGTLMGCKKGDTTHFVMSFVGTEKDGTYKLDAIKGLHGWKKRTEM